MRSLILLVMVFTLGTSCALAGEPAKGRLQEASAARIKGEMCMRQRNWSAAQRQYRRAMKILEDLQKRWPGWEPETVGQAYIECRGREHLMAATLTCGRAFQTYMAGRYSQALTLYTQLLDTYGKEFNDYPAIASAWLNKGHILRMQGKPGDAMDAYEGARDACPGSREYPMKAYFGMALASHDLERDDEARGYLQAAKEADPAFDARAGYLFDLLPVSSWDSIGAFPVILEFLTTGMPEKVFLARAGQLDPENKDEYLAFIGFQRQMKGELPAAKRYYRSCMEKSRDKQSFGYRISAVSLEKIAEVTE